MTTIFKRVADKAEQGMAACSAAAPQARAGGGAGATVALPPFLLVQIFFKDNLSLFLLAFSSPPRGFRYLRLAALPPQIQAGVLNLKLKLFFRMIGLRLLKHPFFR